MPKITLHIPLKDVEPILKGIKCSERRSNNCPYIDSYETKLFWDGYDAHRYEDSIFIREDFGDEIEIFNGHYITFKNN